MGRQMVSGMRVKRGFLIIPRKVEGRWHWLRRVRVTKVRIVESDDAGRREFWKTKWMVE